MPFDDDDGGKRGGGNEGCCLTRMTVTQSGKMAELLAKTIRPLCGALHDMKVCPSCATEVVIQTMLLIARTEGDLQHTLALEAFSEAFNSVYEADGVRITGMMLEGRRHGRS